MQDRNGMVSRIQDLFGAEGWGCLAELIFRQLRADGRITWDDNLGFVMDPDVDVTDVLLDEDLVDGGE